MLKVLYVGPDYTGSNGTCWRDALVELGYEVRTIDAERLVPEPVKHGGKLMRKLLGRPSLNSIKTLNATVVREYRDFQPDITFYIKAEFILADTAGKTAELGPNFAYMNDDMFNPANQTIGFPEVVRHLQCIITTKSFNVREFQNAGAPFVLYLPNAYDPKLHRPVDLRAGEAALYSGDVAFVGTFRSSRADFLARLAERSSEFRLNIWGGGWKKMWRLDFLPKRLPWRPLFGSIRGGELWGVDMARAFRANKICLGLLNHENRDAHTSRTFEIPACGGFMLAERTQEHRMFFEEDKEAVYFNSFEEMLDKIRFYLGHESTRQRIAMAGYERCVKSGNRYVDRARAAMTQFQELGASPGLSANAGVLSS
jgi:spore maturation protein CgeB